MATQTFATASTETEIVAEQARKVRALYPELFAALDTRDRRLHSAVGRLGHPHDPESWVPWSVREEALLSLHRLDAGIGELARTEG
ncbi:MAG TPA: hypothetical protein VFN57_04855 [Thermomicrobiaceae bacterium]|nr:hypothetical protein [Thermomicrobiaceae bacterium]